MVPMGIDKEKVMLQLRRVEEYLGNLRSIANKLKETEKDVVLLHAAERLLQIAIEECLNIGSHIIAGLGLTRADTYREVFTRLKDANILSGKLGEAMEEFASFRNRLVHLYYEVSKEEVVSKLEEIYCLKDFAKQIVKYIESIEN
ncbi:MAG: hypothetical protein AMJ42_05170 [Deltaproteobacteria bacterium DG_8]|nr:MAG: hypothetical protein AMJ42_05170 [Deltaproteobacteria bacterium DG_8]